MYELAKLGGYLLSPLTLVMGLFLLAGLCLGLRRHAWAVGLAAVAFAGLWLASTPFLAGTLAAALERGYPALAVEDTPTADAIVILGGALIVADPPERPSFGFGPAAGRVWHAALLFQARKAPWVVVAAGNQPGLEVRQVESQAIAEMLQVLGVPRSAIHLESSSRNTLENASNLRPILARLGARRILLVTSAQHMPRAVRTFRKVWAGANLDLVPAPVDVSGKPANFFTIWEYLPSTGALLSVTKSLKEFAGLAVLTIMEAVTL